MLEGGRTTGKGIAIMSVRSVMVSCVAAAAAMMTWAGAASAEPTAAGAAAARAPTGTGNFRRAEVLQAAGNLKSSQTTVMGFATANRASYSPIATPANARVMAVVSGTKVELVKAPLD